MQTETLLDLEQYLVALYEQQKALYTELVNITSRFPADYAPGPQMDLQLGQMHTLMDQISELDAQLAEVSEAWKRRGGSPGPKRRETLNDVEQLILTAMGRINAAEKAAAESKERLAPRVSAESRRRKMAVAYRTAQQGEE